MDNIKQIRHKLDIVCMDVHLVARLFARGNIVTLPLFFFNAHGEC